ASSAPAAVMDSLVRMPQVKQVLVHGDTKTSVVLSHGIAVDLRVVPRASWGAAMVYFTGSKAHAIRLRRIAQTRGLLLNEYGLFKGDASLAGAEEEDVCRAPGLAWNPPELRA